MLPPIAAAARNAALAFRDAGMPMLWIRAYGCVSCQRRHYEGDAEFAPHLCHQSKHGWQNEPYWHAVWDRYLARERKEHASK